MAFLKERNVQIVDTTCPWVSKVWRSIERSKDKGYTSIIHGKSRHEETIASTSFAETYLVVKDLSEAEYVANYILGEGTRDEFMQKFKGHMSEGFNPDVDLDCVSVANQTTMLKGDTELIGRLFERVMIRKHGPHAVNEHFLAFNTICDATQERQDAMYKMLNASYEAPASALYADLEGEQVGIQLQSEKQTKKKKEAPVDGKVDEAEPLGAKSVGLCLVVGGFNSSNTTHLIEIPEELGVPTFHIDCAARIGGTAQEATNVIQHKPLATSPADAMLDRGLAVTEGFLPDGPVVIAVTAGASTPDGSIGACLQRVLAIRGIA
jgi:4-hydroxy-3-methylbut-2-enyl diphosphate reductase